MEQSSKQGQVLEQIDIMSIVKDILREWIMILMFAVSLTLLADVYLHLTYRPQYTAKSTFVVTVKGTTGDVYSNLSRASSAASLFGEILNSSVLKKSVAEELGIPAFTSTTKAQVIEETNLMELSVTDSSPLMAYRSISSIMRNYSEVSDYLMDNIVLDVIQYPALPKEAANPLNETRDLVIVFIVALILAMVYVGVFSNMRDTIKNEKDINKKVAARHLGTIYLEKKRSTKKSKNQLLLINPLLSFRFAESTRMAATRVRSRMDRHGAKVLVVTSVGEHEGKSTVAANLAIAMAEEGKKVALIDCDLRKPTQWRYFNLEVAEEEDLALVLQRKVGTGRLIRKYKNMALYLVLSKTAIFNADEFLGNGIFEWIINFLRKQLDYIIIDTSPMGLVSDTEEIANHADASVLVIREDVILAKDINDTIDVLNRTNAHVLGCILNYASGSSVSTVGGYAGNAYYGYGGHYGK